jgi:hypothetical protein
MKPRAFAIGAALLLLVLLPGPSLAASAVLDQHNDGTAVSYNYSHHLAQTFTVGKTGLLSAVDLYLQSRLAGGGNPTIWIKAIDAAGYPTGAILATGSVPVSHVAGWVAFPIATPLSVTSGLKLAVVFNILGDLKAWGSKNSKDYLRGHALQMQGSSWVFMISPEPSDFAFKTYVVLPPTPTPTPTPTPKVTPTPVAAASSSASAPATSDSPAASETAGALTASSTSTGTSGSGGSALLIIGAIIIVLALAGGGLWFLLMRRRKTAGSPPPGPTEGGSPPTAPAS